MIQLVAAVALMYLVVGSAGYWGIKKRQQQMAEEALRSDA